MSSFAQMGYMSVGSGAPNLGRQGSRSGLSRQGSYSTRSGATASPYSASPYAAVPYALRSCASPSAQPPAYNQGNFNRSTFNQMYQPQSPVARMQQVIIWFCELNGNIQIYSIPSFKLEPDTFCNYHELIIIVIRLANYKYLLLFHWNS